MNRIISSMLEETDKKIILRKSSFWNMVASILNATFSSILLFVITRTGDVETAGIFSISSAIAFQCLTLGNFGSRNVQVSDIKRQYSFYDFCAIRIISSILMYSLLFYYSFLNGYSHEKAIIVFSFGIFKSIDALEDIVHGEYHRNGRLDIAAILLTERYIISIVMFIVVYLITKNLFITSLGATVISLFLFLFRNKKILKNFISSKMVFSYKTIKALLLFLIPITLSNYVRMYAVNLPKYAIDANLTSEIQTYFNVLIMPVFIINLLSDVIFRPYITKLSIYWHENKIKDFNRLALTQLLFILLLTVIMMIGGYVIGLSLLEIVYGLNLKKYMLELVMLLIAGGFNTAASFGALLLTIQKKPKQLVVINIIATLVGITISTPLVCSFEIFGASILYLIICFVMFVLFFLLILYTSHKLIKKEEK